MSKLTFHKIFIYGNIQKKQLSKILSELLHYFEQKKDIEIVLHPDLKDFISTSTLAPFVSFGEMDNSFDLAITLGGDGTVLRFVQKNQYNIPILSVNLGGLGFLTEITVEEMDGKLEEIFSGNYYLDERILLQATVESSKSNFIALNDVVIDKAGFPRIIFLHISVDNIFFNDLVADGIIISSPTGSTGYSLSAGGPLISPEVEVILLSPICPHSLTNRPVVFPSEKELEIQVFTEYSHANLVIDGQVQEKLQSGEKVKISPARRKVKLVRHQNTHFFEILRNKLHWGEDLRNKERWAFNIKKNEQ